MKPHLVTVAALALLLASCGGGGRQAAPVQPRTPGSSCPNPAAVYLTDSAQGSAYGEGAAWLNVSLLGGLSSPTAVNDGRLVEAVVADGPIWSVEDLWLTAKDAARVRAFAHAHVPSTAAIAVRACFIGRHRVTLGRLLPAKGAVSQRANQLFQGIEVAGPTVASPGGRLVVVTSRGSMYDTVYRSELPGGASNAVWYAYDQTKNLLYRLPDPVLASTDEQDVFVFTVPADAAPGSYFLALLRPPMPRSPGTKSGEPGFGFMNGEMPGGFTFDVEAP